MTLQELKDLIKERIITDNGLPTFTPEGKSYQAARMNMLRWFQQQLDKVEEK